MTPGNPFEGSKSGYSEKSPDENIAAKVPRPKEAKRMSTIKKEEYDEKVKKRIKEMRKRRMFCCC